MQTVAPTADSWNPAALFAVAGGAQAVANRRETWIQRPEASSDSSMPVAASTTDSGIEAQIGDAIGGGLQKAYMLILPPSSPAGGASAALSAAAGIASDDMTGQSAGNTGNTAENIAQTDLVGSTGMRLEFMFNPKEYTISKSADWDHSVSAGGWPTAIPQWKGAKQRSLSMEIFFDTTYQGWVSVKPNVDLLFACMQPTLPSLVLGIPSPPFVMFGWGESLSFLAYIAECKAKFTMFKPDGTPVRAACDVTLKEIPLGIASQNPTSGGRARRTRRLVAGDTLQSIATREYGKPTLWRAIANANGIEDPTRVAPGTTVLIPPRSDAAALG